MSKNIAFVFPGQGSQTQGMMSDFYESFPVVKHTFDEASSALSYDIWNIITDDPQKLSQTEFTQPALLTSSVAILRLLRENHNIKPKFLAGHSLGEYSALVAANAVSFSDAVKLVSLRGQYMQNAVSVGVGAVSAIIGLDGAAVIDVCKEAQEKQIVCAVNFNAPGQVVIAGDQQAVERANLLAKGRGAKKTMLLPVSVPVHCELMKPAAERLAVSLSGIKFQSPTIPVVHNTDVDVHAHPDDIKSILVEQIYSPVRWSESIQLIHSEGVDTFVEIGPGKVLSGLSKRIAKGSTLYNTANVAAFENLLSEIS